MRYEDGFSSGSKRASHREAREPLIGKQESLSSGSKKASHREARKPLIWKQESLYAKH
jgi:hypothetical protein